MCSKPREDCSTIRRGESTQRVPDDDTPHAVRAVPSPSHLDVQPIQHPGDRRDPAAASPDTDRVDQPCHWTIGPRFDHEIRRPQIAMQVARLGDATDRIAQLGRDRAKSIHGCVIGIEALRHRATLDVHQFDADQTHPIHPHESRTVDHVRRPHTDPAEPCGSPGLADRLRDPEHMLDQGPGGRRPVLRGPRRLTGPLDEPDAAQPLLLEGFDGMFGGPGHGRSIAGSPRPVV